MRPPSEKGWRAVSEMVERVARAMFPSTFRDNSGLAVTRNERRKTALNKACVAIAAMREPTEEMAEVGYLSSVESKLPRGMRFMDAWRAMVDETLK